MRFSTGWWPPCRSPPLPTSVLHADIAEDDVAAWLAGLSAHDPEAYRTLVLAVAARVYLDPGVRRRLGYDGQIPRPVVATVLPEYVDEGLLDAVLSSWAGSPEQVGTASPPRPGSG